jgi:hypothetical protein
MEHRKWRGESLLRPDNRENQAYWYDYTVPVWLASRHK